MTLMSETSRLSPMTSYYLRKFIEDRQEIVHQLLPDLHGEITLDRLFVRMSRQDLMTDDRIRIIESLVDIHKKVAKSSAPDSLEVQNLDKRLLLNLGVKGDVMQANASQASVSIVQDCVDLLNALRNQALFYLGDKIGTRYLLETRPTEQWCQQFEITSKAGVTYDGKLDEGLNPEQINCFETWTARFSQRCGNILTSFEQGSQPSEALFDNL